MLMSFRNLVLSSAALCATAAFAAEQSKVEVPFSFVAKNHTYQAGSYTIAADWVRSSVTLRQIRNPSQALIWIIGPGAGDSNHPRVSLIFDVTGPDHVLRSIRYGAFTTPNLDAKPKQRVERIATIGE